MIQAKQFLLWTCILASIAFVVSFYNVATHTPHPDQNLWIHFANVACVCLCAGYIGGVIAHYRKPILQKLKNFKK
jgi:hypothetical protein